MVKIAGQLGKLLASVLLLVFLLLLADLVVVLIEIFADLFVLGLDIGQILLASIEIVLPSSNVVAAVAEIEKQIGIRNSLKRCLRTYNFYIMTAIWA